MEGNSYTVLFVNPDGLYHITINNGIQHMTSKQIERIGDTIQHEVVPERFEKLKFEAVAEETGILDVMKFIISVLHEAIPISFSKFRRIMGILKFRREFVVVKLARFSAKLKKKFYAQGRFVYKLKHDVHATYGSENSEDFAAFEHGAKYVNVLTYMGSEATVQLQDKGWCSTSQTTLHVFRNKENDYFAVTNGRPLEKIEKNAEPASTVLEYFKSNGPRRASVVLDYKSAEWKNEEGDMGLHVLLYLLEMIYFGEDPVDTRLEIII